MSAKSINQILDEYKRGTLTPIDIAEECIEKSEKNIQYQVWENFNSEMILKQAKITANRIKNGEILRKLEGIPVAVKDIYNTIDFPTQMGSLLWKGFTPGNDARVVYNLKQAGAIIAGKTVTAEFAVHELNKTLNPYDVTKTPGTSSSGSAVAVALGLTPISTGTQTAASITRPASFCGVYGCKPSFGTIPRTGMLKTTDSLDSVGFFATFAEDLELMFDVLRVHGPNYPFVNKYYNDFNRQNKAPDRPWKIAFVKTHTWEFAEDYAKTAIVEFVNKLSNFQGISITEVDLPVEIENSHKIHSIIYDKSLSYYFQEEAKYSGKISSIMNSMIETGEKISIEKYHNALDEQTNLCHIMDDFLKDYDAVLSLSTSGEAPDRGVFEKPDSGLIWTLTHLPVVSVPLFYSPNNLAFGLQLTSRRYNDLLLFNLINHLVGLEVIPRCSQMLEFDLK